MNAPSKKRIKENDNTKYKENKTITHDNWLLQLKDLNWFQIGKMLVFLILILWIWLQMCKYYAHPIVEEYQVVTNKGAI